MNALKIAALALIAAGICPMYGGLTYTKEIIRRRWPFEMAVKEKETISIRFWAGVGAIVLGAGLLLVGSRKT